MMNVMVRTYNQSGADSSVKVGFSRDGGVLLYRPLEQG